MGDAVDFGLEDLRQRRRVMSMSCKKRIFWIFIAALLCGAMDVSIVAAQTSKPASSPKPTSTNKVDLNTATEKELDSLPGVGPATAKKIIAGRPYSSANDLSKAGVSASTIKKISGLVTVSGGTAAATGKASNPVPQPNPTPRQPAPAPPPQAAAAAAAPQGSPGPGTVWVNLDSGVYHYENSRYYGKTKNGKYMSEADAVKAGYRPAKNEKKPQ
jgi:hypothetical protein